MADCDLEVLVFIHNETQRNAFVKPQILCPLMMHLIVNYGEIILFSFLCVGRIMHIIKL